MDLFRPSLGAILSLLTSYLWFIYAVGGFQSSEALAMGVGYGILFMMPTGIATIVAVLLGRLTYRFLAKREARPLQLLLNEVGSPPAADSTEGAVDRAL